MSEKKGLSPLEQLESLGPRAFFILQRIVQGSGYPGLYEHGIIRTWLRPDLADRLKLSDEQKEVDEPDPAERVLESALVKDEEVWDEEDQRHYTFAIASEALEEIREAYEERAERERLANLEAMLAHIFERFEIKDSSPLGKALHRLDRCDFVHDKDRYRGAMDAPVPLGHQMTESALHAVVMTILAVKPVAGDQVLICGAKGGYLAALMAELVGKKGSVCCLDWQTPIAEHVRQAVARYSKIASRVEVLEQPDVTIGCAERAPWDVVVFNGAIPRIPYDVLHQLNDESGRLLFYLKDGRSDVCHVIRKNEDIVKNESLSRFRFTGIPGAKYGFESIQDLQEQYEQAKRSIREARTDLSHMQTRVPYPLARVFMSAFNSRESSERHSRTLKAFEVLIKSLAVPCLRVFDNSGETHKQFSTLMANVGNKPSLGHWLGALRETSKLVKDDPLGALIERDHEAKMKNRAVLEAYQMLEHQTGRPDAGLKAGVSLREFLQKMVTYRNKSGEGHGALPSNQELGERSRLLLDALKGIISNLRLFETYSLLAVEEVQNLARKKVQLRVRRLDGIGPVAETWEQDADGVHIEPGVYLAQGRDLVLLLAPWMVWAEGKQGQLDFFLYNGKSHGGMFHYLTYHNNDEYPSPTEQEELLGILERHRPPPPPKLDPEQARLALAALMSTFVLDGVIDQQEMMILSQQVVSLGLVDSPDEVRAFVERELEENHPEVYIE